MPLGIVSLEEFEAELTSTKSEVIEPKLPGRGKGNIETPNVLRKVIAQDVIEGGSIADVSEAFSISRSSISAYIKGVNSTSDYSSSDKINRALADNNLKTKEKIIRMSRRTMRRAINQITDEKLAASKPGELAMVARSMGSIATDLEPEVTETHEKKVVITYRPRIRQEDDFQVLNVSE